ncbi:MAG: hypothetical protein U1B78_01225, partial [Dehalococcoidia bacterium]|nr:hypothetical protein [Dehalococcoidia bacterium]
MTTVSKFRVFGLLGLPLLAIVVAVMVFAWNSSSSEPAQAVGAATGQLEVKNAVGGPCSATKCSVIANSIFTLSVDISAAGAYSGIQTEVTYAGPGIGLYKADTAANEIVWPPSQGVLELRSPAAPTGAEGIVNHAASSAILPPRPAAVFLGNIVEIDINCLVAGTGGTVALVPFDAATNTNASGLDVSDGMPSKVVPISDSMDINCVQAPTATNTPTPTSTPEVPSIGKSPSLQNLFLTRQGAKIPPSTCIGSTNSATLVVGLDSPIATVPDPKDPDADQELGAFEFDVKYDEDKVCVDITAGPAAANMICAIEDSVSKPNLEGVARIGCVTLGKNTFPDTSTQAGRILAILTVKPQPDNYSVIKPNQDNGNATQLLNAGCELADLQGHPISTTGVCADADVTIRYLEGDVEPSCSVSTLDTQAIAFRWGANKGSLLYNDRFNLEPSGAQEDQDVDIKDLQFVYGRF